MAYAHDRGVVHRDLKPENVLLDAKLRPRVTDFGLAKQVGGDSGMTATGQIMGTPAYMAPEQARGVKDVGPPADIYALGGVLYFLLTGRPPFVGEGLTDLLIKVATEQPDPPTAVNPDVPAALEEVCLRCLCKSPEQRYGSAAELHAALLRLNLGSASQISLPSPVEGPGGAASNTSVRTPASWAAPSAFAGTATSERPGSRPAPAAIATPAGPAEKGWSGMWVGLALAAAAVGGVGAYLATRGPAATDDKTKVAAGNGNKGEPGDAGADKPKAGPPRDLEWPAPKRVDFPVEFEIVGAARGVDGVVRIPDGVPQQIRIKADKDAYFAVWSLNEDGSVMQIFPNDKRADNELKAGRERLLPEAADDYKFRVAGDGALERLRVMVSTDPLDLVKAEKNGPFELFIREADKLKLRSFVVESKSRNVTEAEVKFRVVPK